MSSTTHLWAIGYDDMGRAEQVRETIENLAWDSGRANKYLLLLDIAVVVRHPDGSFTVDRHAFSGVGNILGCTTVGFIAGLILAAPLTGATLGALMGGGGTATAAAFAGISDEFIGQVKELMKPASSALFVLDDQGDMDVILHTIRGLGGTILKTNVDAEQAKLIQSTLAADASDASQ